MNENDKQAEPVGEVTSSMQQNGSQCFKPYVDDGLPIGAKIYATARPVQPDFSDAYQGARGDVEIWKKRALEAEELNHKFIAQINDETFMGEPAQQVQPAVAQGEPVHFRAVLCSEQHDKALGVVPKVAGFVDKKAAEQFILEQRDFKGWKYNLDSLYTEAPAIAHPPADVVNDDLAKAIHYPQCWDVAAYPTLAYAISELATCFQCCECVKSPAVAVNEQLLRAAKKYFVNYCLDEASEFFAEDTGCRQEQHDDAVELREAIAAAEAAKGGV